MSQSDWQPIKGCGCGSRALPFSQIVLQNVDKAELKLRAKKDNVAGKRPFASTNISQLDFMHRFLVCKQSIWLHCTNSATWTLAAMHWATDLLFRTWLLAYFFIPWFEYLRPEFLNEQCLFFHWMHSKIAHSLLGVRGCGLVRIHNHPWLQVLFFRSLKPILMDPTVSYPPPTPSLPPLC